jgi:hypothetical protein
MSGVTERRLTYQILHPNGVYARTKPRENRRISRRLFDVKYLFGFLSDGDAPKSPTPGRAARSKSVLYPALPSRQKPEHDQNERDPRQRVDAERQDPEHDVEHERHQPEGEQDAADRQEYIAHRIAP